jgi:ParB-like chromosome segregation protein Spo0J
MAGPASKVLDRTATALREAGIELPGKPAVVRVDQLVPNTWNPNRQDDETFAKEKQSLRRFGFVLPIVTRSSDPGKPFEIIDGEHRWKAAIELDMEWVPIFDVGPISDHEAMQLTIVLNELRGKAEPKKLGDVLKRLLASDTIDSLTEVLPYSKEDVGKIAELPDFNWNQFKERTQKAASERMVERIFRLPVDANKKLNEALEKVRGEENMSDSDALAALAGEYLA